MADKLDFVFKQIVSRQYSTAVKRWYEENPGVPFKLKGSDVWIDPIPSTPPSIDTATIKKYDKLTLVKDITVGMNKSWVAEDPADTRIGSFIQPRYGQGYFVRLYDHNNKEIPTTDPCGWFWNYETGNLTFDIDPSTVGWNATSFKIDGYRYRGVTADRICDRITDSVWQEPTIRSGTVPSNPSVGDRYLIDNPDPGSIWDGHDEEICQWDGFEYQFTSPKAGMITYVINDNRMLQYTTFWDELISIGKEIINIQNIGITLTPTYFGETIVCDSSQDQTFVLPSVNTDYIGYWFRFVKLGTGKLIIKAPDDVVIADSDPGGTVYNGYENQTWATLTVLLISENKWILTEGHGTWITTT